MRVATTASILTLLLTISGCFSMDAPNEPDRVLAAVPKMASLLGQEMRQVMPDGRPLVLVARNNFALSPKSRVDLDRFVGELRAGLLRVAQGRYQITQADRNMPVQPDYILTGSLETQALGYAETYRWVRFSLNDNKTGQIVMNRTFQFQETKDGLTLLQ